MIAIAFRRDERGRYWVSFNGGLWVHIGNSRVEAARRLAEFTFLPRTIRVDELPRAQAR